MILTLRKSLESLINIQACHQGRARYARRFTISHSKEIPVCKCKVNAYSKALVIAAPHRVMNCHGCTTRLKTPNPLLTLSTPAEAHRAFEHIGGDYENHNSDSVEASIIS